MEETVQKSSRGQKIGRFLLKTLVASLAVYITAWILPGVWIDQFLVSILVAFALGLINAFLRPVLVVLTIPVTIFTFGLFLLVINAALVMLVSHIVPGFHVDGFWWALAFSLILSLITGLLEFPLRKRTEQAN